MAGALLLADLRLDLQLDLGPSERGVGESARRPVPEFRSPCLERRSRSIDGHGFNSVTCPAKPSGQSGSVIAKVNIRLGSGFG